MRCLAGIPSGHFPVRLAVSRNAVPPAGEGRARGNLVATPYHAGGLSPQPVLPRAAVPEKQVRRQIEFIRIFNRVILIANREMDISTRPLHALAPRSGHFVQMGLPIADKGHQCRLASSRPSFWRDPGSESQDGGQSVGTDRPWLADPGSPLCGVREDAES